MIKSNYSRRQAFTLVELLVVIGIIAVLVGILLPALGKARRSAQGAACLSNLRQLSNAVVMYASENDGWMVCRAGSGQAIWNGGGASSSGGGTPPDHTANWIAWSRTVDPINLVQTAGVLDQNITYSGLAKYLSIPYTLTTYNGSPNTSNVISDSYDHVFICPGDDRTDRPNQAGPPYYRYSYSLNDWVAQPMQNKAVIGLPAGMNANTRVWGTFNGKLASVRQPSNIVLFACEDSATIDDGVLKLDASQWATGHVNTVSPRHTNAARSANNTVNLSGAGVNQDGYGNASFCDGHAEVVSRKDVLRSVHSGNPVPDPAGF